MQEAKWWEHLVTDCVEELPGWHEGAQECMYCQRIRDIKKEMEEVGEKILKKLTIEV